MNAITEWALSVLDYSEESKIETVVETPWSRVIKINTLKGNFYLKQTPPSLFIETDVIKVCKNICNITDIPELVAENKSLNCFIMKECGDVSLRTFFDGNLNVDILIKGLKVYKTIQKATPQHVDTFIKIGAPDWRLEKFPRLYQDLVNNESFMQAQGLESAQINILQDAVTIVEKFCQALANYYIPECLNHSDFHDNNMLISHDRQKVTIIDLGETAINHPFFSLAACLKGTSDRYQLTINSSEYQRLQDSCFQGWLESEKELKKALELTQKLLPVYFIFAEMRLMHATSPEALSRLARTKNRIRDTFIAFIKNIEDLN